MSETTFAVHDELPEGAQPISTAQSVGLAAAPPKATSFRAQEIDLELPDGRIVTMVRPKAAQSQFIAGIMKNMVFEDIKLMGFEQGRIKSLLYVSAIDGQAKHPPSDHLTCLVLEQELGDDGCDLVYYAFQKYFAPLGQSDLKVVKKS